MCVLELVASLAKTDQQLVPSSAPGYRSVGTIEMDPGYMDIPESMVSGKKVLRAAYATVFFSVLLVF